MSFLRQRSEFSVGRDEFDKETSNFKNPFFLEEYADYIPVGAITGNANMSHGLSVGAPYGSTSYRMMNKLSKQYPGLYRLDKYQFYNDHGRVASLRLFSEAIKFGIDKFLKPVESEINVSDVRSYTRATYDGLVKTFFSTTTKSYYFQSTRGIIVGAGYVYHIASKEFLFCMVLPTKLIKHFKLHFMTEGKFPKDGVEFWIKKDFDSPRTLYKGFRSSYRKLIKPQVQDLDIPFYEKNEIAVEMMPVISVPESISELKAWKVEIAAKTLQRERESITFSF